MKIIGLCGGSGSGKSTVGSIFLDFGFLYINTDELYHAIISSPSDCTAALADEFGKDIISCDGSVNRKKLSASVFAEGGDEKLKKLNEITHFYILKHVRRLISEAKNKGYVAAVVDAPLLFESGFSDECDIIVSVIADDNTRIRRITERDGIGAEAARARIAKQLSNDFLIQNSDFAIFNDGGLAELTESVKNSINEIVLRLK